MDSKKIGNAKAMAVLHNSNCFGCHGIVGKFLFRIYGDDSSNQGQIHESLNIAKFGIYLLLK